MITTFRPLLNNVTQPVVNILQSVVKPLTQSGIFQSTYSLANNAFQVLRNTFTTLGQKISQGFASLFTTATTTPANTAHESDVIEVDTCDLEEITNNTHQTENEIHLLTKKTPISTEVEKMITPLMVESDSVRAEVTAHLTHSLKQHGAQWRDHLPQIKSLLSESNRLLKITDSLGYSRDTEVMTVIEGVEKGILSEVHHDLAQSLPREAKNIYTRLMIGDLMEMSQAARETLHQQQDFRATSYRGLMKELYLAGPQWKQKLQTITSQQTVVDTDDEVTNRMTVKRSVSFAAHSESKDIAQQAETITRLMMYPSNAQRINDRQSMMDSWKKREDWKSYSHELLSSLKMAHQLGLNKNHQFMKTIEQQVLKHPFLEAFQFLSSHKAMNGDARRYFFTQIVSGALSPDSIVVAAKLLHSGRGEIVRTPQGRFLIRNKKQNSNKSSRAQSGLSSNTGGSGSQSRQQSRQHPKQSQQRSAA